MSLIGAVDRTLYLVACSRWCRGVVIELNSYDLGDNELPLPAVAPITCHHTAPITHPPAEGKKNTTPKMYIAVVDSKHPIVRGSYRSLSTLVSNRRTERSQAGNRGGGGGNKPRCVSHLSSQALGHSARKAW